MTVRIIGIDPGSRQTGFGIIDSDGVNSRYVFSGCIYVKGDSLAERLGNIFTRVSDILEEWQPLEMAIEQVFVNKNVDSALKLGQARGAAICAGVQQQLQVSEYTPKAVKNAVVGTGNATKEQVQLMMGMILKTQKNLQADEADALGVALCHAHHRSLLTQIPQLQQRRSRRGRWL
ncbi:MAG: crossover junction endodeoxyribonuclease RuvC [Gammaproteobacteria bacterium]|nr:MAG: crossover junction endodeoxyribonuclease RuvC [Gammaproteobacteria bacterium]